MHEKYCQLSFETESSYIGVDETGRKYFCKKNSSPIIALLAAEKIVPKLVWAKRMDTGEVMTAQHWENGRTLHPNEMLTESVAHLLKKLHTSKILIDTMQRLNVTAFSPQIALTQIKNSLDATSLENPLIRKALSYLENHFPTEQVQYCICHGDVNHNNWLLSDNDELYLVDWEETMYGDPAIDIGYILYTYVPESQWSSWLNLYGIEETSELHRRMKWYVLLQALTLTEWYKSRKRYNDMNEWLYFMNEVLNKNKFL